MEMKLFGDDLRVEVDIWELFQNHDRTEVAIVQMII